MSSPSAARRSAASHRAILAAALEETAVKGLDGATVESIAARAGVGKQTIYRWWPSKAAILVEALAEQAAVARRGATFPDTGDIRADLRTQMRATVRTMKSPVFATYRGLIAAAQHDRAIARAVHETIVAPRVAECLNRLRSAQQAGQIGSDVDLGVLVELLYGPLYYRLLLHTRPVSNAQIDAILATVLPA